MKLFWFTLVLFLGINDIQIGKCEKFCNDKPPRVENAILKRINIDHGAILTYTCDQDYYKAGYGTVKCVNGIWRGKSPVCKESRCYITDAKFPGIVASQHGMYMNDEAITPQCSNGYKMSNEENNVMRCFNGEWKGATPPCILEGDKGRGDCDATVLQNGEFVFAETTRYWAFLKAQYVSETIYKKVRIPSKHRPGSNLYVRCRSPYIFNGNDATEHVSVTCENGQWDPPPYCLKLTACSIPENLENGRAKYCSLEYGAKLSYECNEGFRLDEIKERICGYDGKWSGSRSTCIEITCNVPENLENGKAKYDSLKYGAKLSYECNKGFRLDKTKERICDFYGKWNGSRPTCIAIACSVPENPENGRAKYDSLEYGVKLSYECNKGFQLDTRIERICGYDGKWSGSRSTCSASCTDRPPQVKHAMLKEIDNHHGAVLIYICDRDYYKAEYETIKCINGTWSGKPPVCKEKVIQCPEIKETEGLTITYTNNRQINSNATFHCAEPYRREGAVYATCLANRKWTEFSVNCTLPTCVVDSVFEIIPITVTVDLEKVTGALVPYGTSLDIICIRHNHHIIGDRIVTCNEYGRWFVGDIKCVFGCDGLKKSIESTLVIQPIKDVFKFGDAALFSCPPGQELTSDVQRAICLLDGWSDAFPDCRDSKIPKFEHV